jgi:hypothetical protein
MKFPIQRNKDASLTLHPAALRTLLTTQRKKQNKKPKEITPKEV